MDNPDQTKKTKEIVHQMEYYLSDKNLSSDEFFHGQIRSSQDGYIDINWLLQCNKVKTAGWTKEEIITAIKSSSPLLEINPENNKIRRKNNKQLPEWNWLNRKKKKENPDMNAMIKDPIILEIAAETESKELWKQIENKYKIINPALIVLYTRFKDNTGNIAVIPSQSNVIDENGEFDYVKTFELNGIKYTVQWCKGENWINFYKDHGAHLDMCINREKNKKKEKKNNSTKLNTPLTLGNTVYNDIQYIKAKSRKIQSEFIDNTPLEEGDYSFIKDWLQFHPDKEELLKDIKEIVITRPDPHNYSKMFFSVHTNGEKKEFVINKCIEKIQNDNRKSKK